MIKLHVGCGTQHKKGYINIDIRKTAASDIAWDVSDLFFPPETIDLIEGYHVLEHLDVNKALSCWNKILVKGGMVIMEVPNFQLLVDRYAKGEVSWDDVIYIAYGNPSFEANKHCYGFGKDNIEKKFKEHGFEVLKVSIGTELERHSAENSIRIEAVKLIDKR